MPACLPACLLLPGQALVERCQHIGPRARTLVTLGSQHQGVMNVPGCDTSANLTLTGQGDAGGEVQPAAASNSVCDLMHSMLGKGAYLPYIRDHLVQAQYFKVSLAYSQLPSPVLKGGPSLSPDAQWLSGSARPSLGIYA